MSIAGEPTRRVESARMKRSISAVHRPGTAALRPFTASKPRRPYSAYTHRGSDESQPKYDLPETNREWWRTYVKETPTPGAYQHRGFLEDLQTQSNTYGFRNTGRRPSSGGGRFYSTGELLMPGAYNKKDFVDELSGQSKTYNFRSIDREQGPKIGHGYGDKEMDNDIVKYDLRAQDEKEVHLAHNSKDKNFKSQVRRKIEANHQFPIVSHVPGPGRYESSDVTRPSSATVNSIFKSKVPRFHGWKNKVPGPGSYNTSVSDFGEPKPLPAITGQHSFKKKNTIPVS